MQTGPWVRTGPRNPDLILVEIRNGIHAKRGFDAKARQLLTPTLVEHGGKELARKTAYYSLTNKYVSVEDVKLLKEAIKAEGSKLVVALGQQTQDALCGVKKTLKEYAGSLGRSEEMDTWTLSGHHPSVVYIGDRKTLNKRYDEFDVLYDVLKKAAYLLETNSFPTGEDFPCVWYGENGIRRPDRTWTGYDLASPEHVEGSAKTLSLWIHELNQSPNPVRYALDTESWGLDPTMPLTMIQVYDGVGAFAFNWGVIRANKALWLEFLHHPNARFILHNTKHDRKVLKFWLGVDLGERDIDTMALALGTTEKAFQVGLKYRSRMDQNAPYYEEALDEWFESADSKNFGHIKPEVLFKYGCSDVFYTYHELPIMLKRVAEEGTKKLVQGQLMGAQRTFADMEYDGFRCDVEFLKKTSAEWEPLIEDAIKDVQEYARSIGFPQTAKVVGGQSYKTPCECVPPRGTFHLEGKRVLSYAKTLREAGFELPDCTACKNKRYVTKYDTTLNVNSTAHMKHLCFDMLGMREVPNSEVEQTTNKEFWKLNANHELAKLRAVYKEMQFLRNNFLEGLQRFVDENGFIHPDFLLFGTKTGRLAVHNPAVQTLPARSKLGKTIKRAIIPDDDTCVIVNVDYKALEMYINAYLTGDQNLLDDLNNRDLYTVLAAQVYGVAYEDVTPGQRQSCKPVVLGSGYGMGAFKLSLDPNLQEYLNGDKDKAQEMLDTFWGRYHVWRDWTKVQHTLAREQGYLMTEFGRKRRWNLITADNASKVNNQAQNFPGQSVGSDCTLYSMIKLNRLLRDHGYGRVILTVHDSIIFNIKKEFLRDSIALISDVMCNPPLQGGFKLLIDIEVGYNYGEVEPYNPDKVW